MYTCPFTTFYFINFFYFWRTCFFKACWKDFLSYTRWLLLYFWRTFWGKIVHFKGLSGLKSEIVMNIFEELFKLHSRICFKYDLRTFWAKIMDFFKELSELCSFILKDFYEWIKKLFFYWERERALYLKKYF